MNNNATLAITNKEGDTPLHLACNKGSKEIILFLLLNSADVNAKNNAGAKPGESAIDMKQFMNNIMAESKALNVLTPQHRLKLLNIFDEIDIDNQRSIDNAKSIRFNKYVDELANESVVQKDAKDFISSCAIINKTTV